MDTTQDVEQIRRELAEIEIRYEWQALTWIVIALVSVIVYLATGGDSVPTLFITFVMIAGNWLVAIMADRGPDRHPARASLTVAALLFAAAMVVATLVPDTMSGWVYGAVFAISIFAFVRKAVMTLRCR